METLIPQAKWDQSYDGGTFHYDESRVVFSDLLLKYVPPAAQCLEVGCFPGNFLLFMGLQRGCTISGIDATKHLPEMVRRFREYPVQTGSFINQPFEQVPANAAFDCVSSFGFIEHFPDFATVIRHHIDFLKPGGTLIIGLPHFRRLQYVARRLLDPKTLEGHYLPSMDFDAISDVIRGEQLEIVARHFWGTCAYWFDGRPYGTLRRVLNRAASVVLNAIDRRVHLPNRWSSPFMLVVARKPDASLSQEK